MILELPEPHINQQAIIDSDDRFRVVMCGRRFGKSELSQIEIIIEALKGGAVGYITPTYNLAKTFFDKLTKVIPFPSNRSELSIAFPNDGMVQFFTGERLDNLRGRKFNLIVIDEASFIPNLEDGWLNSIRPTLTDYRGRALFLSTPKGKNYFYSLYLKGENKEPGWASFKFTTYDNPHIDPLEIDDAKSQLPIAVFEQEYMANPSENAANPFGLSYIQQCTYPQSQAEPVAYGIDLAKSVDWTVIIGIDKTGNVCYLDRFQKDWRQTREAIRKLPKAPMLIDSSGVGDPIVEDLQSDGLNVTGFKFSSTSKQQIMLGLVSAVQQRKITFPEGVITRELETIEYQFSATGVKYGAPSGFHDDAVMALALAWSHYQNFGQSAGRYSFS
jgi:hypothetical protein